jgi:DNA repair ATPase RecN
MDQPFDYEHFLQTVAVARSQAARFVRVDLHAHTIDSHDFPSIHDKPGFAAAIPDGEEDPRNDPEEFKRRFIAQAKSRALRLVAVTDHNQSNIAEQLSLHSDGDLTILPGIEISVQTNLFPDSQVHILALFPHGTSCNQIDKVFPAGCGMPEPGKRGPGSCTTQAIPDLLIGIRRLNAIAIAAHVSSTKGLRAIVHSQNVEWLQKNYLRRYLKERRLKRTMSPEEESLLAELEATLKPLDDQVQNAYLLFLAENSFDAIQIQDVEHRKYYSGEHVSRINLPPFPCLLSSDAHTLADLGCPGHATYIKLATLDLEGLRRALLDPEARIRYDATVPTQKPKRILGMSFEGGSFAGQVAGFSDNLTTLIGGRGTGKSALIEALRYTLAIPLPPLPDRLTADIQGRLAFTLRDAEIKLLYQDENDGDLIIVKRRFGEARPSCFQPDGTPLPEITLPTSSRVRAEIYGWSEIEELSDSSRKQLALLDRTIPGLDILKASRADALEALRQNGDGILAHARAIRNLLPQLTDAQEIRAELVRLSTPALDQAFSDFDAGQAASTSLGTIRGKVQDMRASFLQSGQRRDLHQELDSAVADSTPALQAEPWFRDIAEALERTALSVQSSYARLLDDLEALIRTLDDCLVALTAQRTAIEAQLNALAENSGQPDFKSAMSRRKDLTERLSAIATTEASLGSSVQEMGRLFSLRRDILAPALLGARHALYEARLAKASEIAQLLSGIPAASGVVVQLLEARDNADFARLLGNREGSRYEGLLKNIDHHYMSKNYPGFFAAKFSPHQFVVLLMGSLPAAFPLTVSFIKQRGTLKSEVVHIPSHQIIQDGDSYVEQLEDGTALTCWRIAEFEHVSGADYERIWKHLSPYWDGGEVSPYPDTDKLAALLDLELVDVEDAPMITLNGNPIEHLSPGQRCSALIPLILAEGRTPLIIDQPEDNLDNKLVFDLVVDVLRDLKEQRQIIVATHNPNIPVSGDAEQVLVFEAPSKTQCCVAAQASIDAEPIVRHIKAVMEGGDKAFEMRMKKYGLLR